MKKIRRTKSFLSTLVGRKAKRVMAVVLTVFMAISIISYGSIITANAQTQNENTYDISKGALTINKDNISTYNNAVITGISNSNMITIDGVTANLTLSDMKLNIESSTSTTAGWYSAIKLTNGATLNLTITGTNTLTGGTEHAAINVPAGCSLVVTKDSTGTLTATAGGGSAGIGADCGGNYDDNIQILGNITINGANVKAYGQGTGAGIGGTMRGSTGNIVINGGTVYAKGGGGILSGKFEAVCGAGIGGGSAGYVKNITITGGNVTAVGGHRHESIASFKDAPAAGIGCGNGTGVALDGKYTCGVISITGGTISATGGNNNAVNAIGYGLSPNFDISGDNYTGSVTISDNASVNTNGGAIHPSSNIEKINMYKLAMTIYDGRLAKTIEGASVKVNGKTYCSDINVSEKYVGTISSSFLYNGVLKGEQTVEISAGDYSWSTKVNFTEGNLDYTAAIGNKLYPVYLWFYDTAIKLDISGVSLSVNQNGNVLNSNASQGIAQLACDGIITKYKDGVGKMTAYMPAGASELTATVPGLNGGKAITVSGKTINASADGTIIIMCDKYAVQQLSSTLDLSYGNITFADNGGKLDITYTPGKGQSSTTVTGQYYQNEYEIVQSDSTATSNQIIFNKTTDFVNVKLNGVNMKSTGKAIDLQNAKAKLNLSGINTIDCGGGAGSSGDAAYYIGIHAASGSELTIDGSGSLEVRNPSYYGVGIGGYYNKSISEGAGTIRIQGGTLTVCGKNGSAIGSSYLYSGDSFGSIYISGGMVNASSNSGGAAIGGSCAGKPANVYISGGRVTARTEGYYGGAAIGSGYSGIAGGKIVISGGYVEATATGTGTTAIGGSCEGACPDITISGGTVKATGAVASIGTAPSGSGGSLKITGGSISTINNGKPTINLTPTKDGTTPVYYTTAYVGEIYGKDAPVNNAAITGSNYGFNDVKTDSNGFLHLYLPASAADTATKASFNDVNYSGIITSGDSNSLQKPFSLSGTGTQTDPYIIKTADDLEELASCVRTGQNYSGKYFKLNNDITYSSMPIGSYSGNLPFCGNFDGAGHTVTLAMTNENSGMEQAIALFGYLGSGASVENVGTTGTITSSEKYSGGIAGVARDGAVNISNCSSNVEMNFTTGGDCTYGGIVGLINNSANVTMTNCCFTGKIITSPGNTLEGVGGLCGWEDATLNAANCYVDASFGSGSAKGKYMARHGGSFTNCYYNKDKTLTDDGSASSIGNAAATNDFTSGKVAWLLQNEQSNLAVQAWGQTLTGNTKDSDPVLSSDSARAVHKVSYYQDNKELENVRGYVNSSMTLPNLPLTEEEKNQGYRYNFEITSGTATLDTANNQLKDIGGDVTVTVKKGIFYTINTKSMDSTLGTVGEGGIYAAGATATLIAKPRMGCKFVKWSSDATGSTVVSTEKVLTITANNSSTYYAWFTPDKYKLTVGDFNSSEGTVSGVKGDGYSYNEQVDLKAEANIGYTFDGWKNEYGVTVATSPIFSFNVSGNMTITPIFTQIKENTTYYTAAFYHQSGDLLKSEKIVANSTITPPNTPSKIGYDFIGWSIDGKNPVGLNEDGSITITSNMSFKPLFKVKEVKYSLIVNGKQATYAPLSSVTAQADTQEGKNFAYWKDENGNIVSYSNPYNFSLTGNITLTAVYENSTEPIIKKPTLTLGASTYELVSTGKHKMIWYAAMDLPEGYTLVESGILRVVSTTPQTNEQMTFETNEIYRRIIQVSASIPNQYYYSVPVSDGKGVSVRAYIVVRDKDGNLDTIFSDVQYGCYK